MSHSASAARATLPIGTSPTLSIVIPVWNVAPWVGECLESIALQTRCDFEVIVVDDGSTDGTIDVCRGYESRIDRVTLLQTEHRGLAPARQVGAASASGKWLWFIDGDDVIAPNAVETLLEAGESAEAEAVVMGHCRFETGKPGWGHVTEQPAPGTYAAEEFYRLYLTGTWGFPQWTHVFRRSRIESLTLCPYWQGHAVFEDVYFFSAYYREAQGKVLLLPDQLYGYRRRVSSLSLGASRDQVSDSLLMLQTVDAIRPDWVEETIWQCRQIGLLFTLYRLSARSGRDLRREVARDLRDRVSRIGVGALTPAHRLKYLVVRTGAGRVWLHLRETVRACARLRGAR